MPERKIRGAITKRGFAQRDRAAVSSAARPISRPDADSLFETSPVAGVVAWTILAASVAVFALAVLSVLAERFDWKNVRTFHDDIGYLLMLSAASAGAAFWFLCAYPKWVRQNRQPGALPTHLGPERGLPPALIAFGKVAPLFFLPTGMLGVALVIGRWTEKEWARTSAASATAGAAVLVTSVFVLLAAPRVWARVDDRPARHTPGADSRKKSKGPDANAESTARFESTLRTFAPFFSACSGLLGIGMLLGRARPILDGADRWEVVLCGLSLIATAACAVGLSAKVKPQEASSVDKLARGSVPRKQNA